jgi:hypothetical protein
VEKDQANAPTSNSGPQSLLERGFAMTVARGNAVFEFQPKQIRYHNETQQQKRIAM